MCLIFLPLTTPMLVDLFVPYPTLDQVTIYEGVLHVKQSPYRFGGRRSSGGEPSPTNFVVDAKGVSYKIFWGIKGDRYGAFSNAYEGLKVKVWFSPWYGVVQGKYETTPELNAKIAKKYPPEKGYNLLREDKWEDLYQEKKIGSEKFIEYHRVEYHWMFLPFLVFFIYTTYCFRKYLKNNSLTKEHPPTKGLT